MTVIGVTGHLAAPRVVWRHAAAAFRAMLAATTEPHVLTSLAPGADQLCASLVRMHPAASLRVVIPAADYTTTMTRPGARRFRRLVAKADQVKALDFPRSGPEAYAAAGQAIVDECDVLVAVWDGQPTRGPGGTGDVVAYAKGLGRPVRVLWTPGARR